MTGNGINFMNSVGIRVGAVKGVCTAIVGKTAVAKIKAQSPNGGGKSSIGIDRNKLIFFRVQPLKFTTRPEGDPAQVSRPGIA